MTCLTCETCAQWGSSGRQITRGSVSSQIIVRVSAGEKHKHQRADSRVVVRSTEPGVSLQLRPSHSRVQNIGHPRHAASLLPQKASILTEKTHRCCLDSTCRHVGKICWVAASRQVRKVTVVREGNRSRFLLNPEKPDLKKQKGHSRVRDCTGYAARFLVIRDPHSDRTQQ